MPMALVMILLDIVVVKPSMAIRTIHMQVIYHNRQVDTNPPVWRRDTSL
jgi:hypothetical protein